MQRQKKQVIVLAVILAAAIIAFFTAQHYTEQKEAEENETYTAYSADTDNILKITCTGKDVTGYTISDESGTWTFEDTGAEVDSDVVSSLTDTLSDIESETYIKDVTDMDQYGINDPQLTVTVTDADGNESTLTFGDYNSVTQEYYLRIDDQNIIYGASESDYDSLARNAEDMAAETETETETDTESATETEAETESAEESETETESAE